MTGDASKPYTCHGVVDPSARARWLLSAVTASGSQGSHAFGRLRKSSSVLHQLTPMSMYTLRGREHRPSSDAAPVAALTPTQANASTWRRRNPQHCMRTTPSIENFTTRAQRSVASHACKQKKSPRRVRTGTEPSQKEAPRRDGGHIMRLAALVLLSAHDLVPVSLHNSGDRMGRYCDHDVDGASGAGHSRRCFSAARIARQRCDAER